MGTNQQKEKQEQDDRLIPTSVRLPKALVEKIDEACDEVHDQTGVRVKTTQMVIHLIEQGLERRAEKRGGGAK